MQQSISGMSDDQDSVGNKMKKQENHKNHFSRDVAYGVDLWKDGLICAFEFVRGHRKTTRLKSGSKIHAMQQIDGKDTKQQVLRCGVAGTLDQNLHSLDSASLIDIGVNEIVSSDDQKGSQNYHTGRCHTMDRVAGSYWIPIGWARVTELVQTVLVDADWAQQPIEFTEDDDDITVADVVAPYWERLAGPTWWCHVAAGHPLVDTWLANAHWLHPAISIALRDESRLISQRMKYLLYEVPVRVAGGLLFELLGQSAGDPLIDEDDIPVVLRSWQAQNFLITALHVKGTASNINVLGITEIQELLAAGGSNAPRTVHEVIAHLICRLSRWDDRLFRKSIFGTADELELKFMNRRNHEDLNLFSVILNQEIRWLSKQRLLQNLGARWVSYPVPILGFLGAQYKDEQTGVIVMQRVEQRLAAWKRNLHIEGREVIRVKWSLHAREEIVFELLQHLRGTATRSLLEGIRKNTREMIEEQEAVRGRLFTIQDVMQSTVRAWLQDRSLRVTHNLAVFGGGGLVLSIITGLFGINVDGIPGANNTPYAFALFSGLLFFLGIVLVAIGLLYLGLKNPMTEEQVEARKLELEELVKMFQHEAETHSQVRREFKRRNLPPTAADMLSGGADYILID